MVQHISLYIKSMVFVFYIRNFFHFPVNFTFIAQIVIKLNCTPNISQNQLANTLVHALNFVCHTLLFSIVKQARSKQKLKANNHLLLPHIFLPQINLRPQSCIVQRPVVVQCLVLYKYSHSILFGVVAVAEEDVLLVSC